MTERTNMELGTTWGYVCGQKKARLEVKVNLNWTIINENVVYIYFGTVVYVFGFIKF